MKTSIIGFCAAITLSLSFTNVTVAQESRDFKTALEECFWGLILNKEDQRGLALGLNVVSGALGSYAFTSATASADTFCSEKTMATAAFINESYPSLLEDTARGNGEHLTAVLELAGCNEAAQRLVTPLLRADMAEAVSAPGYLQAPQAEKVLNMLQSVNTHTAQACTIG